MSYELRDAAFLEFLRAWKPSDLGLAQQAFHAGWAARKHADYLVQSKDQNYSITVVDTRLKT